MIHMDIDLLPSSSSGYRSFRQVPMNSSKRARSPDSEAHFHDEDRPSKRLFVTTAGLRLAATDYAERSPTSSFGIASVNPSRYPSEDWVEQAGGLSIESPMYNESKSANPSYEHLSTSNDVDVSMDMGESPIEPKGPQTIPSTLPLSYPEDSHIFSRIRPQINVVPATPSLVRAQQPQDHSNHSPTSPMAIYPQQSLGQMSSPQSRRPKFTMGPRADCEKCRLGVKGHWMHLD